MNISIVIHSKLPPQGYGGIERAAFWLGRELALNGHKITFVCNATSPIHFAKTRAWAYDAKVSFDDQLERSIEPNSDFVHFFSKPTGTPKRPYLVTIQGNGNAGERFHPNSVFLSKNHAERHQWTEYVYNGVPLSDYPLFTGPKKRQLAFLSRSDWKVKNLSGAVDIAKGAGMPLRIGGGEKPFFRWPSYFAQYLGPIDTRQKIREISDAKALIFPVIWQEPFGIAVIESLAVGTPVIASPFGAMPELIDNSCGRICHSQAEFIEAVAAVEKIDVYASRKRVEKSFTSKHMMDNYLKLYQKILCDGRLREGYPQAASSQNPEELFLYSGCPKPLSKFL